MSQPVSSDMPSSQIEEENKRWKQLCEYAYRCVVAEQSSSLIEFTSWKQWFIYQGDEKLITGLDDSIEAPEQLHEVLEAETSKRGFGRALDYIYGWPTVVFPHNNSQHAAPLFYVTIQAGTTSDGWKLHATSEPELNQAIIASDFVGEIAREELLAGSGSKIYFGNLRMAEQMVKRFAELAGLDLMSELDISNMEPNVGRATGIYNSAALYLSSPDIASVTVREELRELKNRDDWRDTAAGLLVTGIRTAEYSEKPVPLTAPLPASKSMEQVLRNMRIKPLTVVTGPPGTGKTQLVANTVANAWQDGQSVLVTSTNNAAVDVAVERSRESICDGLLVRTGNKSQRLQIEDRVYAALSEAESQQASNTITGTEAALNMAGIAEEREHLLGLLESGKTLDFEMLETAKTLKVWNGLLWPESEQMAELMDDRTSEKKEAHAKKTVDALYFRKYRIKRFFKQAGVAIPLPSGYNKFLVIYQEWLKAGRKYKKMRSRHKEIAALSGDAQSRLLELDSKWHNASRVASQAVVAERVCGNSEKLGVFNQIGAGYPIKKAISRMLSEKVLTGWACTTYSMKQNFELKAGLFDLVVFDEASQCNLGTVLPVAYRAKRLGVIGDLQQLRPVVRVGGSHLRGISEAVGLDNSWLFRKGLHYGEGSAYTAFESVSGADKPVVLDEHYRCHPTISRWFSRHFYKEELVTLTEVAEMSERDRNFFWIDVNGESSRTAGGSWQNPQEAAKAVDLAWAFHMEGLSVGVLTPFLGQEQLVRQLFIGEYGRESFSESGIIVGTAHKLQGAERDAVVFSTVLSKSMNPRVAEWVEKERNLVNVAASRAKQILAVLGSPDIADFAGPTLCSLRAYSMETEKNGHSSNGFSRVDSKAEHLLLRGLKSSGLMPHAKLLVEGYELDFALFGLCSRFDIEVDGCYHMDERGKQRRQDLQRDRILESLGWKVLRIPAWRCYMELDDVIDEIKTDVQSQV